MSAINAFFLVGQVVRIHAEILGDNGQPADPGTLALHTRVGGGEVTVRTYGVDAELVRDGVGLYHADLPLEASGVLYYRWETDAPHAGAGEGKLSVAQGRFA